jgi:alpha-beta hydrolase superfamily lysophospholipase
MITIYVHGQGGNRRQGSNDWTFGGNFNRIKNLMAANGGLYLVPDVREFGPTGVARIGSLIDLYARQSPGAPVFVACGSAGGAICYGVANAPATVRWLSGLIMLGSFWQDDFIGSPAFRKNVPIFFGQGSRDPVFAIEKMEAFYRRIREKSDGYPVMFVRFESGSHGTPIRMTDWRETLNWMLMRRP